MVPHVEIVGAVGHHEIGELELELVVGLTNHLDGGLLTTGGGAIEHHSQAALIVGGCRTNGADQGSTKCK